MRRSYKQPRRVATYTDDKNQMIFSETLLVAVPSLKIIGFKNFIPISSKSLEEMPPQEQPNYREIILSNEDRRELCKQLKSPSLFSPNFDVQLDARSGTLFYKDLDQSRSISEITEKAYVDYQEALRLNLLFTAKNQSVPVIIDDTALINIEYHREIGQSEENWLNEENIKSSVIRLNEDESMILISEKTLNQRLLKYSLNEETWRTSGLTLLRDRINLLKTKLPTADSVSVRELINIGPFKPGLYSTAYKGVHRESHTSYLVKMAEIKTVYTLLFLLNEIEVLDKLVAASGGDFVHICDIQLIEGDNNTLPYLEMVFKYEFGSLEELAEVKKRDKQEWQEEELLAITKDLINKYVMLNDFGIQKRDIKPSNIILTQGSKRLVFLDYSLSSASDDYLAEDDVVGTPRFMSPEANRAITDQIATKYSRFLSELYTIGMTILSIIFSLTPKDNEEAKHFTLEEMSETVAESYPILWHTYLRGLLDPEPLNREKVVQTLRTTHNNFGWLDKYVSDLKCYNVYKSLSKSQILLSEYKFLLSYLWDMKNYALINEMKSCIVDDFFKNPSLFRRARNFLEKLANLYKEAGRHIEELSTLEGLIQVVERFKQEKHHRKDDYDRSVSELHKRTGDLYKLTGNSIKALESYEKALFIELLDNSDDRPRIIRIYFSVADLYETLNQDTLALDAYEKIHKILSYSSAANLNLLDQATLYERIAKLYIKQNKLKEALKMLEDAKSKYRICHGETHSTVSNCYFLLGEIYKSLGDIHEAVENYQTYCYMRYAEAKNIGSETAALFEFIADYLQGQERLEEAMEHYEKALYIYEQNDNEEALCVTYKKIGESYAKQKKSLLAINNFRLCYQTKLLLSEKGSDDIVAIIEKVGDLFVDEGQYKEALNEYSQALSIASSDPIMNEQFTERILHKIATASPLAFLSYRNYLKRQNSTDRRSTTTPLPKQIPVLIAWNQMEDVKGVLEKVSLDTLLKEVREMIEKESRYLGLLKYNFIQDENEVDYLKEETLTLEKCLIKRDGYNYLILKQDKNFVQTIKQRATC